MLVVMVTVRVGSNYRVLLDEHQYYQWDAALRANKPLVHVVHDLVVRLREADLEDDAREDGDAVVLEPDVCVGLFREGGCLAAVLGGRCAVGEGHVFAGAEV